MKNKIIAVLVALGLVGSVSAIEVNENFSINGFIDGSYHDNDLDGGAADHDLGLDEVEIDFLFNAGGVSAEVHLDSHAMDHGDHEALGIEQAFISYTLESGIGVTFGRFGSNLGLEREDPAGLYTYSRAYSNSGYNLGDVDNSAQEGVRIGFANDVVAVAATLFEGTALNDDDLDVELSLSYTGIENLVLGAGIQIDNEASDGTETDVLNVTVLYNAGKLLFGLEYTELDQDGSTVALSGQTEAFTFLVDYEVNEKLGVAFRYSDAEAYDDGAGNSTNNYEKFTIAPNYAITESLGLILEYSDVDIDDTPEVNANEIALELTFTF